MKNFQICSIFLVVSLFLDPVEPVAEGFLVEITKFPYIVRIERALEASYAYLCSGAALTPAWTLTAAQCSAAIGELPAVVRLGNDTSHILGTGFSAPILEVVTHPSFYKITDGLKPVNRRQSSRKVQFRNDIGLVRHSDIALEEYAWLSVSNQDSLITKVCHVFGYGLSNVTDEDALGTVRAEPADGRLRALRLRLARCPPVAPVVLPSLCGAAPCASAGAVCYGDQGGAVLCDRRLAAIVSAGLNTCDFVCSPSVGVFTPVSSYTQWIMEQIKKPSITPEIDDDKQDITFRARDSVPNAVHEEGMKKENLVKTRRLLPSNFIRDNSYEKRNRKLLQDIYFYYDAYK